MPKKRVCEECGYDVHTVPVGKRCPECGAIVRSNRFAAWMTEKQEVKLYVAMVLIALAALVVTSILSFV